MSETAEWVLHIDITPVDSWDDVPRILEEIIEQLTDLPLSDTYWSRKDGILLGRSEVVVFDDGDDDFATEAKREEES